MNSFEGTESINEEEDRDQELDDFLLNNDGEGEVSDKKEVKGPDNEKGRQPNRMNEDLSRLNSVHSQDRHKERNRIKTDCSIEDLPSPVKIRKNTVRRSVV